MPAEKKQKKTKKIREIRLRNKCYEYYLICRCICIIIAVLIIILIVKKGMNMDSSSIPLDYEIAINCTHYLFENHTCLFENYTGTY